MRLKELQRLQDKDKVLKIIVIIAVFSVIVLLTLFTDFSSFLSPCVGIITIEGEISLESIPSSLFDYGKPGAEDIAATIMNIEKIRPNAKALVVVINSPGGSVVGSRIIRDAIKNAKVPVVAYLSEVAASGGYYIATGSNYIIADPNSITGSIGVIAIFPDLRGLLEKLGINITAITTGKYKGMGSFFEGLSEEQKVIVESILNETYKEFIDVILEGRNGKITRERLMQVADGRILSGRQAQKIGLVDETGMKEDAIKKAMELANIKERNVCEIKVMPGKTSFLMSHISALNHFISSMQGLKFK